MLPAPLYNRAVVLVQAIFKAFASGDAKDGLLNTIRLASLVFTFWTGVNYCYPLNGGEDEYICMHCALPMKGLPELRICNGGEK